MLDVIGSPLILKVGIVVAMIKAKLSAIEYIYEPLHESPNSNLFLFKESLNSPFRLIRKVGNLKHDSEVSIEDLINLIQNHYNFDRTMYLINSALHSQAMYHRVMLENNLKLIGMNYSQLEDDYDAMKSQFLNVLSTKPKLEIVGDST